MNKYEIIGIVGEGAYGIVYKAKNKDTGEYGKWQFRYLIIQPYRTFYDIFPFTFENQSLL